jgi:hypothetical protein
MIGRIIALVVVVFAAAAPAATFTDVTAPGFLIRSAAAWNEVEIGYNQRLALHATTLMPTNRYSVAGDGLQYLRAAAGATAHTVTRWLQEGVSNLVVAGWYTGTNMPDTATVLPVYTNFVDFALDAGISTNGFRRATSYDRAVDDWTDPDDAMWSRAGNGYGTASQGDIIGPWLIDDLQRALGRMDIAVASPTWFAGGVTNAGFSGSQNAQTNWADAVSGALAAYPGSPTVGSSDRPLARFTGRYYYSGFHGGYRYEAGGYGWFNRARWNAGAHGTNALAMVQALGGDVAFYAFSIVSSLHSGYDRQFDANGTGLVEDAFARFSTASFTGGDTNQYHYSGWLNDSVATSAPPACDEPGAETPERIKGFAVTAEKALIRLNWSHTR